VEFHESVACERLVEAAAKTDARAHVAVLLGGHAVAADSSPGRVA
jgi:hypothetical protein